MTEIAKDGDAFLSARSVSHGPAAEPVGAAWYVVSIKLRRERFAALQLARHPAAADTRLGRGALPGEGLMRALVFLLLATACAPRHVNRSEEHTSELQSL